MRAHATKGLRVLAVCAPLVRFPQRRFLRGPFWSIPVPFVRVPRRSSQTGGVQSLEGLRFHKVLTQLCPTRLLRGTGGPAGALSAVLGSYVCIRGPCPRASATEVHCALTACVSPDRLYKKETKKQSKKHCFLLFSGWPDSTPFVLSPRHTIWTSRV